MIPSSPIVFVGHVGPNGGHIAVDVYLRGDDVGRLYMSLDQWDQLRDDARKLDGSWLSVVAQDTLDKADR